MKYSHTALRNAGFGLAEIMVGLAIGMIATLVIVQVATTFEGQKRSTTGSADAQTTGSVALYTIQRQVQMAGYGLPVFSQQNQALNCAVEPMTPGASPIGITPVVILDGGPGISDTIAVRMGSTTTGGVPLKITSAAGINPVTVTNNLSCQPLNANGLDVALVTDGVNCSIKKVTALPSSTQITLDSVTGSAIAQGSSLACMGNWTETRYTISGNQLLENGAVIAGDVVSMQARYGISSAGNNNKVGADSYVDATDPVWGGSMTTANRNRIKAIRIALVVRNGSMEKSDVTQPCTAGANGPCAWIGTASDPAPAVDLSADPNWKRYRYRVFDTIIPVRNMIWSANAL
jgi:type IV pilus assembly protein PilW